MLAMYGHTWASQYGDHASGVTAETWASALAGVTGPQIAQGLRACVAEGREFPPSAPRFRAMCMGIPSLARVKLEISDGEASRSPFTRMVWHHLDTYAYRHASAKDAARLVQDAYELASDRVMHGSPLPQEAAGAIEQREAPKPVIPPTREERLQHMQALLGGLYNPDVADPEFDPAKHHAVAEKRQAEAELHRDGEMEVSLHPDGTSHSSRARPGGEP